MGSVPTGQATLLIVGKDPINYFLMSTLLDDIVAFIARADMAESTFGKRAANDGKLVARLRAGGQCLPRTEKAIRDYMARWLKEHS